MDAPGERSAPNLRTLALTVSALLGFAANSLLCRAALRPLAIDAASFTLTRLASGAIVLTLLARRGPRRASSGGSWLAGAALFAYAIAFSFAYLRLTAGTGALILFGVVQATMILVGVRGGERLGALRWLGIAVALTGLVVLTAPGLTAPDPLGAALMALAGVAWGTYSLLGRGCANPLAATADNFARSVPLAIVASVIAFQSRHAETSGVLLAVASGALASGLGYCLWYAALRSLSASRAAVAQLAVPPLVAVGSVFVLGEPWTARLSFAGLAILLGIALAVVRR